MARLRVVAQDGSQQRPRLDLRRTAKEHRGPLLLLLGSVCWFTWVALSPERTAIVGWSAVALLFFGWLSIRRSGQTVHHYHHNVED